MTDLATGEMPADPMPTVPLAPDLAELEAAAPDAAAPDAAAPTEKPDQAPAEADAPAAAPEFAGPSTSQLIVDHFIDSEGDQSIAQIIAGLNTVSRNTVESAVRRLYEAGRLLRVAPGIYRLGPEKPAETLEVSPPSPADHAALFDALEAWAADPSSWNAEAHGPPPDHAETRVPHDIALKFTDRVRKRLARERDRQAAFVRQAESDRQLRDRLIEACCHGRYENYTPALVADDLRPVRMLLALGVSLDRIVHAVRWRTDNDRLATWRDERLLRKALEYFARIDIVPRLMKATGTAQGKPTSASKSSPGTSEPAEPESAPEPSPQQPDAITNDNTGEIDRAAAALMRHLGPAPDVEAQAGEGIDMGLSHIVKTGSDHEATTTAPASPPAPDRQSILAAFQRNRTPPPPATQPPESAALRPQLRPAERPWFAPEAPPREELSPDAVDELIAGWRAGNLPWPKRLLGEEPGHPDCRLSRETLRRNGLL